MRLRLGVGVPLLSRVCVCVRASVLDACQSDLRARACAVVGAAFSGEASTHRDARRIENGPIVLGRFTTLVQGYITYGNGEFDGQDSGHDFYGVRLSPHSWRMHREQPGRCIRARRTVPYAICHFLWLGCVRVHVKTGTCTLKRAPRGTDTV